MTPSTDTIYWIFSTLPQVLGALVGLIVTGVLFYYPSLDKRVATKPKDGLDAQSIESVVAVKIKHRLHGYVVFLLFWTAFAIAMDIIILLYCLEIVHALCAAKYSNIGWFGFILFWMSLAVNAVPIIATGIILSNILHPNFESCTMEKERIKIIKGQQKIIDKTTPTSGHKIKITEGQFYTIYQNFQTAAWDWAKSERLPGPYFMQGLIKRMELQKIVDKDSAKWLEQAVRISHLIYLGSSVPTISGLVGKTLVETTEKLNKIIAQQKPTQSQV